MQRGKADGFGSTASSTSQLGLAERWRKPAASTVQILMADRRSGKTGAPHVPCAANSGSAVSATYASTIPGIRATHLAAATASGACVSSCPCADAGSIAS